MYQLFAFHFGNLQTFGVELVVVQNLPVIKSFFLRLIITKTNQSVGYNHIVRSILMYCRWNVCYIHVTKERANNQFEINVGKCRYHTVQQMLYT